MGLIVFVFGLPGSGKSAAARHIKSFARQKKFRPRRFRDYILLYKMFQDDQKATNEKKRFRSTQHLGYDGFDVLGFDVLDFDVLDKGLQKLHHDILQRKDWLTIVKNFSSSNSHEMTIAKLLPFLPHFDCMMPTSYSSIPIFQLVKHALKREQTIHGPWMIVTSQIIVLKITTREIISDT